MLLLLAVRVHRHYCAIGTAALAVIGLALVAISTAGKLLLLLLLLPDFLTVSLR